MTVKQLIKKLKQCDPKRIVILSRDGEGNNFSTLVDLSTGVYRAHDGRIGLEPDELTPSAKRQGYTEDDVIVNGKKALVLWSE